VMITPSDGGGDIFAGPSSPDTSNPFGGLWFVSKPWGVPEFGLSPSMNPPPAGWTYEGWYMRPDGTFLSTGRFSDVLKVDDRAPYKNADPSLNVDSLLSLWTFPGEDFLQNAPMGWTFPLDVHTPGSMAFVTLEPEPDLSPAPFLHLTAYCKELTPAMVSNVQYPLDTPPLPSGVAVLK
ncbi:MAG: hypothetical protein ACE5GA_06710, partial [Candidatus Zixiibacteriota bacterium]